MEEIKPFLRDLLSKDRSNNKIFKRNILKESLQVWVLDYIYSHKDYNQLIFYGGSCLAHCYSLPRLSEDLDFVDLKNKINLSKLAEDLEKYFNEETDIKVKAIVQKFRIYLKFLLLGEFGIADRGESDLLFLKVEIFKEFNFCSDFKIEIIPLFKVNHSILIKSFDLETLMATKVRAIFFRKWEKTDKKGKTVAKVKGRDYFDLMWYLEKEIKPNIKCLKEVKNIEELKEKLKDSIKKADSRSIYNDLEAFVEDRKFLKELSINLKDILIRDVDKLK